MLIKSWCTESQKQDYFIGHFNKKHTPCSKDWCLQNIEKSKQAKAKGTGAAGMFSMVFFSFEQRPVQN